MNALEWGWKKSDDRLVPIPTDLDIAPPELKKIIRCQCKMPGKNPCSTKICTCRKHGVPCLFACTACRGEDCNNCDVSETVIYI